MKSIITTSLRFKKVWFVCLLIGVMGLSLSAQPITITASSYGINYSYKYSVSEGKLIMEKTNTSASPPTLERTVEVETDVKEIAATDSPNIIKVTFNDNTEKQIGYVKAVGTIFRYPDIIKSTDKSAFVSLSAPTITEDVSIYDREAPTQAEIDAAPEGDERNALMEDCAKSPTSGGRWIDVTAYTYQVSFERNASTTIYVRKCDFEEEEATVQATKYAKALGRVPHFLHSKVERVNIMKGNGGWGGGAGNKSMDITIGDLSVDYEERGIIEETMIHELCHALIDVNLYGLQTWTDARKKDGLFLSDYAFVEPNREDIAESMVPFIAATQRSDRITREQLKEIVNTIGNRISFFEGRNFDLYPLGAKPSGFTKDEDGNIYLTTKIGNQTWMAENLRTTKLNDGSTEIQVLDVGQSFTSGTKAMYWYDDNASGDRSKKYGALYNWNVAKEDNVCPTDWHIPSTDDWRVLLRYWYGFEKPDGSTVPAGAQGLVYASNQLRAKDDAWISDINATNSTGFSAMPSGLLWNWNYYLVGTSALWWGPQNGKPVYARVARRSTGSWTKVASRNDILPIRCLKNADAPELSRN